MGDKERHRGWGWGGRIKQLQATPPVHPEMWFGLIIFPVQEHANALGPSHSHHIAGSQMDHKGRKWF